MSALGAFAGMLWGVSVKVAANNLAKQRNLHQPWVHAILAGAFGYFGYHYQTIENDMLDRVNQMRTARGLKPFLDGDDLVPYTKSRPA